MIPEAPAGVFAPMMTVHDTQHLSDAFVRLQQGCLRLGYRYLAADARAWPLTNLVMEKAGRLLLLALVPRTPPDRLREVYRQLRDAHAGAGVLLAGALPVHDPRVSDLFLALRDAPVAYVDLESGHYRGQDGAEAREDLPDALTPAALDWLLAPETAARVADVDCRAALKAHLAEQRTPTPWLTYAIIAACVAMFGIALALGGMDGALRMRGEVVLALGALSAAHVGAGEWWRLLTAGALHGSAFHLFMNMMALLYFGAPLEGWEGRWRLGTLFLYSVFTSSVISLYLLPGALSVGASGGLFGLLGGMVALLWRYRRTLEPDLGKGLYDWLKSILPINLVISFVPGINWAGHFGGFLGGFLLGLVVLRPPFVRARLAPWERVAVMAVLLLTGVFTVYVIGRIPAALLR